MANRSGFHFSRGRPSSGIRIVVAVAVIIIIAGMPISLRVSEESSPRVACLKGVQKTTFRQTSA